MLSYTCRNYAAAAASMSLVKDLREKSGAPISDVKSALVEANWDPGTFRQHSFRLLFEKTSSSAAESAYQNLRKKGLAAASKKVWTAYFLLQRRSLLCVTPATPAAPNTLEVHGHFRPFIDSDLTLQASRLAAEGLVGIATAQHKAAIVEVLFHNMALHHAAQ